MGSVKENIEKKINDDTDGYKEGAIAGGLVGLVIAAYLRKNIVYGIVIGLIGGGYIGYLTKNQENQEIFIKPKN